VLSRGGKGGLGHLEVQLIKPIFSKQRWMILELLDVGLVGFLMLENQLYCQ
jgi:hypothetical protein